MKNKFPGKVFWLLGFGAAISVAGCGQNNAPTSQPASMTQVQGGTVSAADKQAEQVGIQAAQANAAHQSAGASASMQAGMAMKGPNTPQ